MEDPHANIHSFDPYSIFKVTQAPCHLVKVKVLCGRNITKGKISDILDKPDPYVKVRIPKSKMPSYKTVHKENTHDPEWNEEFDFIIDPEIKNILTVELWEFNPVFDEELGKENYDLDLLTLGEPSEVIIKIHSRGEVHLELQRLKSEQSDLRYGLTLCDEEKQFLKHRKQKVYDNMRNILQEKSPENLAEVPVIGVLGSGGGLRATVGFSGVISALNKSGILDMVTYISGLSGSSWYLGQLYAKSEWPDTEAASLQDKLKQRISSLKAMKTVLSPSFISKCMNDVNQKKRRQQPVSLTDYLGHLVGDVLLRDELDACLSHQREKVQDGSVPLPLYSAIRVTPGVPETKYHEWVEYSPYEINLYSHGISLAPELLNSRFCKGRVIKKYPEPLLQYLLAMFGSAYAIMLSRLAHDANSEGNAEALGHADSAHDDYLDEWDDEHDHDDHDEHMTDMDREENQETINSIHDIFPGQIFASRILGMANMAMPDGQDKTSSEQDTTSESKTPPSTPPTPSSPAPGRKFNVKQRLLNSILKSQPMKSRKRRAARVHNFLAGVKLNALHAFFPFSPTAKVPEEDTNQPKSRTLCMVDAGLSINLPIPPLVKPQRQVDLLISFDFSVRDTDDTFPFQDLLDTEEWAHKHGVPFPPITVTKESVCKEGIKECYVFRDPQNDLCPILVHFVLVNDSFKRFKSPGVPRETEEEKEFGDFPIFDDKHGQYGTFSTSYTEKAFDRLSKMMEYNTLNHTEAIHTAIIECVSRRRQKAKTGMPWEVSHLSSMGGLNFTDLERNADISNEGLEKVGILIGKNGNDLCLKKDQLPQREDKSEDAPGTTSSVKEDEGENQEIGGKCASVNEGFSQDPEKKVERVIQMRTASQGQSSDRNDTADLQEKASTISNDLVMNQRLPGEVEQKTSENKITGEERRRRSFFSSRFGECCIVL